jgi:hypothetical protein
MLNVTIYNITVRITAYHDLIHKDISIFTYKGFAWQIIVDSGFDEWVYWHFFTITVNYNSSHIELLLNDVCLTDLSEESLTDLE